MFQYPLFRIVDCFLDKQEIVHIEQEFQYPLFRIVDCFVSSSREAPSHRERFNIRSFGSWIASPNLDSYLPKEAHVSISALSDRGLLRLSGARSMAARSSFNIRSFGSWIASSPLPRPTSLLTGFNIRSFGSWIASVWPMPAKAMDGCFNIRSFGSWIASRWAVTATRGKQ